MTQGDRLFMFLFGSALLWALYLDRFELIYALTGLIFFEGITNLRSGKLLSRVLGDRVDAVPHENARFDFEAGRALRITVGCMLLVSCVLFFKQLWFFPWFIGFALAGAGISGVCPILIVFQRLGFR